MRPLSLALAVAIALLASPLAACADDAGSSKAPSATADASSPADTAGGSWMNPTDYANLADTSSGPSYADAFPVQDCWAPPTSTDVSSGADVATAADTAGPTPPDTTSGDKFDPPGTNPFVVAAHDPLSTFGADVDTASYEIFKRDVQLYGHLPDPDSVRLEEFVNYFRYADPAPAWGAEHPFSVTLEAAPSPLSATTLLRVGLQGKVVPPDLKPPANLVFLVDVSGSMASADKLPLVKILLAETLDVLAATDTVSIVVYASTERVVLPPTPVAQRELILARIQSLEAGGSTAGQQGLQLAYNMAQQGWIAGGVNHVLLCTDGDFNVGISSTDALVDFIAAKRLTGVTLTVVGFGSGNLNDAMMEAVSNAGDGVYAYIGDADSAVAYAHGRMFGSLFFIAKDLKIQVAFNPAAVHAYRLLGYENNAIADVDFTNDAVDAGEIGSGHAVTALYELVLAGASIPEAAGAPPVEDGDAYVGEDLPAFAEGEVVQVRVRYKAPGATVSDPAFAVDFTLGAHRLHADLADAGDDLRWAVAVAGFAEILKESPYGRLEHLPILAPIIAAQAERDATRSEFAALFAAARAMLEEDAAP